MTVKQTMNDKNHNVDQGRVEIEKRWRNSAFHRYSCQGVAEVISIGLNRSGTSGISARLLDLRSRGLCRAALRRTMGGFTFRVYHTAGDPE